MLIASLLGQMKLPSLSDGTLWFSFFLRRPGRVLLRVLARGRRVGMFCQAGEDERPVPAIRAYGSLWQPMAAWLARWRGALVKCLHGGSVPSALPSSEWAAPRRLTRRCARVRGVRRRRSARTGSAASFGAYGAMRREALCCPRRPMSAR